MTKRAFTLFELLVSISIIGILIAVASMSYGSAQKKARDTRRIEDLNSIQKAAEMYYSQNNATYPLAANFFPTLKPFLPAEPKDPKGGSYQPSANPADNTNYCIGVSMDNPVGNCTSITCGGFGTTTTGAFYCVKNQQ